MTPMTRLETYLREHQVPYLVHKHPRALTALQVAAGEHIPGRMLAKVVMVMADGRLLMLVLPAPAHVDLDVVAWALDAHEVRLATEAEFAGLFPECEVGAMPPFGNLAHIPVYVDCTLLDNEVIYCQAGSHTTTISLRYADYARLVHPLVGAFTQERMPAAQGV